MSLKNRRTSLLLVLAVGVALNGAAALYFGRLDLSEGRIYTLSEYSRKVVDELEEPLTIKVYFSEDVGPQYNQNRTYIQDMLEDYRTWSNGNLHFEMVNPRDAERFDEEARKAGIQPVQAQVVENDQISVRLVYMGISFLTGERSETLPFVGDVSGLEYTITSTIRRLSLPELARVGVIQGHGEPALRPDPMAARMGLPPGPSIATLGQLLEQSYTVEEVHLEQPVDPGIRTLVWAAPAQPVDSLSLYHLDRFLSGGGRLALFADRYSVDIATRQALPVETGLDDLLAHYGIRMDHALVGDRLCGKVTVRQGGSNNPFAALFAYQMSYPSFVEVRGFDGEHPISRKLEAGLLAWPACLDTSAFAAARQAGATVRVIARSSEYSERQAGPAFDLEPVQEFTRELLDSRFTAGPQVLGATVEGTFPPYFEGKPRPAGAEPAAGPETAQPAALAVVADGDFVQDAYIQQGDNLALVQNTVDWLSQDEGLIAIRSKAITARPLQEISPAARKAVKWTNILAVPVAFVLFGLVRWLARRRRAGLV